MKSARKKLYRIGIISFSACWAIFVSIMVAQFIYLYSSEFLNKKIPAIDIVLMLLSMAGSVLHYTVTLATLFSAAIYYRYIFRNYKMSFHKVWRKSWPIPIVLCVLVFLYSAFIVPRLNQQTLVSLYQIRQTKPGDPVEHVDREIFKGAEQTMNLTAQLNHLQDLKEEKNRRIKNLISTASSVEDSKAKYRVLSDSVLKSVGIDPKEVTWNGISSDMPPNMHSFLEVYLYEISSILVKIEHCRLYIVTHFKWALFAIITFYIGLFLGVLSRRIHIILLIFGLNWGISGIIFIPGVYLEKILLEANVDVYASVMLPFIYQLLLVIIFYRVSRHSLKNWSRKPMLIPHLRG